MQPVFWLLTKLLIRLERIHQKKSDSDSQLEEKVTETPKKDIHIEPEQRHQIIDELWLI